MTILRKTVFVYLYRNNNIIETKLYTSKVKIKVERFLKLYCHTYLSYRDIFISDITLISEYFRFSYYCYSILLPFTSIVPIIYIIFGILQFMSNLKTYILSTNPRYQVLCKNSRQI